LHEPQKQVIARTRIKIERGIHFLSVMALHVDALTDMTPAKWEGSVERGKGTYMVQVRRSAPSADPPQVIEMCLSLFEVKKIIDVYEITKFGYNGIIDLYHVECST
jgi:hypothetical protein